MLGLLSKIKTHLSVLVGSLLCFSQAFANIEVKSSNDTIASWFYIQMATSGTCVPIEEEDGYYTLTLSGVTPNMISFTNRPDRQASFGSTKEFIEDWYSDTSSDNYRVNPPNAALVLSAKKFEDMMILRLENPVYDEKAGTITYKVKPIEILNVTKAKIGEHKFHAHPPKTFNESMLFIDDSWSSLGG